VKDENIYIIISGEVIIEGWTKYLNRFEDDN
jgi:hypothetical protein